MDTGFSDAIGERAPADSIRLLLDRNETLGVRRRWAWTTREEAVLRATWPEGLPACMAALPGRSATAIYQRAGKLGLGRAPGGGRREKRVYPQNDRVDEAIRRVYTGAPDLGAVKRLAVTLGRSRGWVASRARALGLVVPRFKSPAWTDEELAALRRNAGMHPARMVRLLQRAGYTRSQTAVIEKRKELRIRPEPNDDYSMEQLCEGFGVTRDTVRRWLERGWLVGERQRGQRGSADAAPADTATWRFSERQVRRFIVDNVGVIDFRKLDRHWLVAVLTSRL